MAKFPFRMKIAHLLQGASPEGADRANTCWILRDRVQRAGGRGRLGPGPEARGGRTERGLTESQAPTVLASLGL